MGYETAPGTWNLKRAAQEQFGGFYATLGYEE